MPAEPSEASQAFPVACLLREDMPKQAGSILQAFGSLWASGHGMPTEPSEASLAFPVACLLRKNMPKHAGSTLQAFGSLRASGHGMPTEPSEASQAFPVAGSLPGSPKEKGATARWLLPSYYSISSLNTSAHTPCRLRYPHSWDRQCRRHPTHGVGRCSLPARYA